MKAEIFKKLLKEAVREVFNEELKGILLEAFKNNNKQVVNESEGKTLNFTTKNVTPKTTPTNFNSRQAYLDILEETAKGPKSAFEGEFNIKGPVDAINGSLPEGSLSMDQISKLIGGK